MWPLNEFSENTVPKFIIHQTLKWPTSKTELAILSLQDLLANLDNSFATKPDNSIC
jgi:hypothetical protein